MCDNVCFSCAMHRALTTTMHALEVPLDNDGKHPKDNNDAVTEDHWESEVKVSMPALNCMTPAPTLCAGPSATVCMIPPPRISLTNSQPAISLQDLLQTFFAQLTGLNPAVPQLPSPTTVESQCGEKASKGIKAYHTLWTLAQATLS